MNRIKILKLCFFGMAAAIAVPTASLYAQREVRGDFQRGNRNAGAGDSEQAQPRPEGANRGESPRRSGANQDGVAERGGSQDRPSNQGRWGRRGDSESSGRGEGDSGRPESGRGSSENSRGRGESDAGRNESERGRPESERGRSESGRGRDAESRGESSEERRSGRGESRGDRGEARGDRGGRGESRGEGERASERESSRNRSERGNETRTVSGTPREQVLNQLRSLDQNLNGKIEPQEGNLLSRSIMEAVGLDPGQSVHLATLNPLISTIDLEKMPLDAETGIQQEDASSSLEFPSASSRPSSGSDFQVHPILSDPQPIQERYSALVLEEVRSLLFRYDENHNNVLDAGEMVNVPWGSPSPIESDLDQNGQLNEIELAERLSNLPGATSSGRPSRSRGGRRDESPEEQEARAQREAEREKAAAERRERERQRRNSTEDKVAVYVRELISRFDKDNDGNMSLEEAKEMRNPPPKSSDTDGDGNLSQAELYAYYGADQESSSSSTAKKSERGSSESDENRGPLEGAIKWDGELPREQSGTGQEWPRELEGKDANQDNMVSLAEFAPEIDDDLRREFARWDKNSDGFVTLNEVGSEGRSTRGSDSRGSDSRGSDSRGSDSRASDSDAGASSGSGSASSRRSGSRGSRTNSGRDNGSENPSSAGSESGSRSASGSRSGSRPGSGSRSGPGSRSGSDSGSDSENSAGPSSDRPAPADAVRYNLFGK
ncbi:MAG: hypothetical protein JNL67_03915 [Planctomycetaceae bacterium]|nr:hypothetical protein [Planctomycetaceae bacterium]